MKDIRTHYETPLLSTHFHPRTSALNKLNNWAPWSGYTTAVTFEDEAMEYTAIRNSAAVYDLCPMVKYSIKGKDAEAYLNRLTIRNVSKLKTGHVHYTAWCDDDGKLMDDGTLFRYGNADFMLCCQERHLPWLLDSAIGFDVVVKEATERVAALSLQGPTSCSVLKAAGFANVEKLKPFQLGTFTLGKGKKLVISRTGFTGDLGYELWVAPEHALALWDRLFDAGALYGIRAIGSAALNIARIEAGFVIANSDFVAAEQALRSDRRRSPLEMGLGWMIDFDKGHFNGRRALLLEKDKGSRCALVGLELDGNVPGEHSIVYHNKTKEVGQITAAVWSPVLKSNIALATIDKPYHDELKNELWVEIYALRELQYHKLMVKARVVTRPFFNPPRRRATPPTRY